MTGPTAWTADGRMFLFATAQMIKLAKQVSKPTGIIDGWQLGSAFAALGR
jgi:hypothetical protein